MLTLERLRYFIAAATLEHVGNAAKNVHVSPSVISSAILSLEEEFNCKFFVRENNRLKLNDKGHVFLGRARALIENANQLYTDVSGDDSLIKGHFKLGGSHFLLQEYLLPTFLGLHKKHPSITSEMMASDTGMAISNVLVGTLDAALVFRSSFNYDLEEFVLKEGHFYIAVKKNHELLDLSKIKKIETLNQLPAITFRPSVGPNFCESHPVFKQYGIIPKHTFYYDDDQTAIQLIEKTNGWAFLPEMMIEKYSNKIEKLTIAKDWNAPVAISLIRNKHKTSCRLTSQLKDDLSKRLS